MTLTPFRIRLTSVSSTTRYLYIHYRCKIPWLDNDTYAVQDTFHLNLINNTVPLEDDGSYKECVLYVNETEQACSQWVYDQSVFTSTIISQVLRI